MPHDPSACKRTLLEICPDDCTVTNFLAHLFIALPNSQSWLAQGKNQKSLLD